MKTFRDRWQSALGRTPRSVRAFPKPNYGTVAYCTPPRNSFDWMGPDWAPDRLSFEQRTIQSQRYAAHGVVQRVLGGDEHATDALRDAIVSELDGHLLNAALKAGDGLRRDGYVLDTEGWHVEVEAAITIRVVGTCWPAVEGVTVPDRRGDDTR